MEIISGILVWLLVWFVVSIPVSLVLAQLLKAASAQLLCGDAAHPLQIRRAAFLRPGPEVRSLPRKRIAPLGASPAVSR